jgi:hypothetical protein
MCIMIVPHEFGVHIFFIFRLMSIFVCPMVKLVVPSTNSMMLGVILASITERIAS